MQATPWPEPSAPLDLNEVTGVSYKLEYKLVQQTPMIHFQSEDPGATIRGSELKPKLDRFIAEWCRRRRQPIEPGWRQDPSARPHETGYGALRYKATVQTGEQVSPKDPTDGPLKGIYFGNIKRNDPSNKYTVQYDQPLSLTIVCFVPGLRQVIESCIETFFVSEAFGTRQNRGFGCFTLQQTNEDRAADLLVSWFGRGHVYRVDYRRLKEETSTERMLGDASVIYRVLKGGLNEGGDRIFVRSYLTKYFLKRGIGGEKRFLKERGVAPAIGHGTVQPEIGVYRYTRALLGTTDGVRYKNSQRGKDVTKVHYKSASPKEDKIERYASPILTRVCNQALFLVACEPDPGILGKTFEFSSYYHGSHHERLRTPTAKELGSMAEVFRCYSAWLNTAAVGKGPLDNDQQHLRNYGRQNDVVFLENALTLDMC